MCTVRASCVSDIPDRELSCVGFWMEDMRSYMITYDEEDAVSAYRCWVSANTVSARVDGCGPCIYASAHIVCIHVHRC